MRDTIGLRAKPRYSFRAFYITVLFISALTVLSLLTDLDAWRSVGRKLARRQVTDEVDITRLIKRHKEVCYDFSRFHEEQKKGNDDFYFLIYCISILLMEIWYQNKDG
jgi:hypothetical protein